MLLFCLNPLVEFTSQYWQLGVIGLLSFFNFHTLLHAGHCFFIFLEMCIWMSQPVVPFRIFRIDSDCLFCLRYYLVILAQLHLETSTITMKLWKQNRVLFLYLWVFFLFFADPPQHHFPLSVKRNGMMVDILPWDQAVLLRIFFELSDSFYFLKHWGFLHDQLASRFIHDPLILEMRF